MSAYTTVEHHRGMIFDDLRNSLYADAIRQAVTEESVVLDLGAGLGLHGLIAAASGARKVYLVDPVPVVRMAEAVARANGLFDQVECLQGTIQETRLPEKVDLIVSVFTGNLLLTEDLLPSLFYARDKYLRPGGRLIPDRAAMIVVPVSAPACYEEHVDGWRTRHEGIDFSAVRPFAANYIYYDNPQAMNATFLAAPKELMTLDFMHASEAAARGEQIQVEVTADGLCHGWLGWVHMRLGNKWFSTSLVRKRSHWRQAFLPLDQPIQVKAGDILSFEFDRPEFGEWTWAVKTAGGRQRQSTFFSEPLAPHLLQKKSAYHKARLNDTGEAVLTVIRQLDGSMTTDAIAQGLGEAYPQLFPSRDHAMRFVIKLVEEYT